MHLLLVEDDADIAQFVRDGLREQGHAVEWVERGDDALAWAESHDFDLVILDVMLPGASGLEVARTLRERRQRVPILMLTARDSVDDRVRGLDSGADDYLVKPFAFAELLARVRALGRRPVDVHSPVLRVGDLELDPATRRVSRGGQPIELAAKDYAILEYLMRHEGQVLTRSMIMDHAWEYEFEAGTNIVDVHIRYLRRKVDDPFPVKLIQTVRGAGYRIAAEGAG
ncbi:MAG: response regulator transcription factor [Dehalococcoidia bacterium]|nr:response regulator transcription factor [Dehalococcoidia bacterium]